MPRRVVKLRVVSLFCGAGFADAALYRAAEAEGIEVEVVAAYDSWAEAVKVYNANLHPVAQVVDVKALRRAALPPHDLIIGGPPCQDHSLAGLRRCQCNTGGPVAPRCRLADFVRLAGDGPYLMENVAPRLIPASFSVKLNAFDFGDVTTRKRWFYSNYLLHIIETPGPRRFRDIRDHEADRVAIGKRAPNRPVSVISEDGALGGLTAGSFHGTLNNDSGVRQNMIAVMTHRPRTNETGCEPYATYVEDDGAMGSLNAGGYVIDSRKVNGQSRPTQDDDALCSLTSGKGGVSGYLKVGLRGHSASASASAFEDDEPIGSLVSNSWHGNELDKPGPGVRCPSILEMARSHSISDSWDWAGATKTNIGKMIVNGWPIGLGTAVLRSGLRAVAYDALMRGES